MPEASRDEQKLWLILFQIKAIRSRLNSLAVQRALFWALALGLGAAAGIVGAALTLGPLSFLTIAAILGVTAIVGSFVAARSAWRMRASPAQAAAIADTRADLKGRLATVHALAATNHHSFLWPYLIEDTYGARDSFEPSRVEPRWLSRSFWALLAALLMAGLLFEGGLAARARGEAVVAGGGAAPGAVTADINNLDIRPADPSLSPNAQIYADPATLKKLQDRIAQQNAANGSLSKLVDKARSFADAIQNDIAGRQRDGQPPVQMRLTDKGGKPDDRSAGNQPKPPSAQANANSKGAGGAGQDNRGSAQNRPPANGSAPPNTGLAANPRSSGPQSPADTQTGQPPDTALTDGEGQGSDHGSGSDPSSLFGQPSEQQLGADNFKIAIDAVPSTEASGPGSPGYLPPKVRAPINPSQYPDEPLARASIPDADQMTIKRVFER